MDAYPAETFAAEPRRTRRMGAAILLLVVAVFSFVAGVLAFLRVGLDDQRLARVIVAQLERGAGSKVSLMSAHLSWLGMGDARLSLRGLEVRERTRLARHLIVPRVTIELNVVRLIGGSLRVKLMRFTEPVVALPAEPESPILLAAGTGSDGFVPSWFTFYVDRLEIGGGQVMITTGQNALSKGKLVLESVDAVLTGASLRGVQSFALKGLAREGPVSGSFDAVGRFLAKSRFTRTWRADLGLQISQCPLLPFCTIAENFNATLPFSDGILQLKCNLKGDSGNFHVSGQGSLAQVTLRPGRYFIHGARLDEARVNFAADRKGNVVHINVAELQLPGMNLSAETTIRGVHGNSASVELAVRNGDFDLAKFLHLIPLNLMSKEDRARFGQAGLNGHVVITSGSWTGNLSDIMSDPWRRGTLAVDAYLDRVSGFIPGAGLPIANATGRVRLSADEVVFNGISLTVGTSPIVLNGGITDLRGVPKSDLFVSMTAQAQDLAPVLSNKTVERQLGAWVNWIQEPHGGISITLDVKGNMKRPSMKGKVVLENFQCRVPQFPLPIRNVNGSLRFRSADVIFSGLKGMLGESHVEVSGKGSPETMSLNGEGKLHPVDLRRLGLSDWWDIQGSIPVTLSMKGRNGNTDFSVKTDLRGSALRGGHLIRKAAGAALSLEASGSFGPDAFAVEDAYVVTEDARVSAKGKTDAAGKTTIYVNLPPKGIATNALIPLTDPSRDLQPGGRIEGDAVIRIDSSQTSEISLDANLVLSHVSAKVGFHKRVDGLTGAMRVKGRSVNATIERAKIGDSAFSGTVSISDTRKPKVEIDLNFPFLDTTDFAAPPGYVSPTTWREWIRTNPVIKFLARSVGTATLKISKGKSPSRTFTNFQAQFEDRNGLIRARQWHGSIAEGVMQGDALFDIRPNAITPLSIDFQADHLRMEQLFLINPERVRLQGDLTSEGHVEWKTTSRRENNGIYKTGKIEVRVQDGVIHRFEALSKIFSFINLGSLMRGRFPDIVSEGLPFQRLSWTMEVFDDKWKFSDVRLLSDAARVDAYGMYFSSQDRIDFKVEVSPLVGLDAIVSGLLGGLVTKDGKILSTTFSVRGLPGTPDVRLEPFAHFKSDRN